MISFLFKIDLFLWLITSKTIHSSKSTPLYAEKISVSLAIRNFETRQDRERLWKIRDEIETLAGLDWESRSLEKKTFCFT